MAKSFKLLLVVALGAWLPVNAGTSCCGGSQKNKAKVICALVIRDCLRIWGNETVEGKLSVLGNVAIGGTLTVGGVPFNNLIGLAGAIGPAGATGATGPAGAAGIPGLGGILGYAYACNSGGATQVVAAGGNVTFNTSSAPSANITAPGIGLSDFTIPAGNAGVYRIQYHVRGTPETLVPPSALEFEITDGGTPLSCATYASSVQTTSLAATGTEAVNGYTLVSLDASAHVIRLHNITNSSVDSVSLAPTPVGSSTPAVNASLIIERIA